MKEVAKEVVEKVKEAIRLDTSSPEAFKASLAAMKDSLSEADQGKLYDALQNLGKKALADEKEGGLLGKVKDIAKAGSLEDGILDKFGGDLGGLTFEELLAFAGG